MINEIALKLEVRLMRGCCEKYNLNLFKYLMSHLLVSLGLSSNLPFFFSETELTPWKVLARSSPISTPSRPLSTSSRPL